MSDPQQQIKQWLAGKFTTHGSKKVFSEATGISPDKITRSIELESEDPKKRRRITPAEIEAIARYFNDLPPGYEGMTQWLSSNSSQPKVRPASNASFPPRYQEFPGDTSIPLRGHIAAGPNGRFILNGQDIARVFCPPGLEGVEGAYAVQVQGTSGEPRFFHGETAWVNPHIRYRKGDDVIVQVLGDDQDDEVYSYIKRFESESKDILRLYQYNPAPGETHELIFDRSKVFSIHKVVFHAMQ